MKQFAWIGLILLVGCSLKPEDKKLHHVKFYYPGSSKHVDVPSASSPYPNLKPHVIRAKQERHKGKWIRLFQPSRDPAGTVNALASTNQPPSMSDLDCLGVNVVGQGIPASFEEDFPTKKFVRWTTNGGSCSYPGVTSEPISKGSNGKLVDLMVPAGNDRVFQVIGIQDFNNGFCDSDEFFNDKEKEKEGNIRAFELGRAVTDVFSSKSVSIKNTYNDLSNNTQRRVRKIFCPPCLDSNHQAQDIGTEYFSASVEKIAQSFTANGPINSLFFGIDFNVSTTLEVNIKILDNNNNEPGSVISNSKKVSLGSSAFFEDSISLNKTLKKGNKYWLVVTCTSGCSGANNGVKGEVSNDNLPAEETKINSGGTWSTSTIFDLTFSLNSCGDDFHNQ